MTNEFWIVEEDIANRTMNCRECRLVIDKGEKYMLRQG